MSDIKGLREISNDPFGKLLTALSKKFSAFLAKDQADQVENPEDIYSDGQDVESAIKYHTFALRKQFNLTTQYYSALEPDMDRVKIYFGPIPSIGGSLKDKSSFDNHGYYEGEPLIVDGAPFDYGLFDGTDDVKSLAVSMNRVGSPTENTERLRLDDNSNISVDTVTTGFSFFIRFRVRSIANQGNISRTLWEKVDGPTPDFAKMLQIRDDGRLLCVVRYSGVDYAKQTATNTIAINTVYDVFVTYTVSGNVIHIYVNNVDQTLTTFTGSINWQGDTSDTSLWIFRRGQGSSGGWVNGDLYMPLIYWDEKVVSATDVSRFNTNKWTTANIPFGQVMISNYSCSVAPVLLTSIFFDGTNDYIGCTNDATLWSQSLTKFSFSFWIYPTAGWDGADRVVVTHNSSNQGFRCMIDGITANRIRFLIKNAVGSNLEARSNTLTLNAWNYVTCVYDNSLGSANVKIYVNAVVGVTTANLTEALNLSVALTLSESSADFKGYMKDFRWWTTTALSQAQITALYGGATTPTPNYWLPMTDGTGNPLDTISGTKIGTLNNGAVWQNP